MDSSAVPPGEIGRYAEQRTAASRRGLHFASDDQNEILWRVLTSRQCLWQLLLTLIICSGVHVLFTWGSLSNWNDHAAVQVCLFRWSHPAGYSSLPTSMAEAMPIDAVLTAFFTCLGAMKRMGDVQRGWAPHVPPDALHRGPLWLLFPRGVQSLPRLSSLLGVTLVWGCLWGGLCLGLLAAIYAANRNSLCLTGWQFIAARACWSTTEGVLISAGSYLLWCSKADDVSCPRHEPTNEHPAVHVSPCCPHAVPMLSPYCPHTVPMLSPCCPRSRHLAPASPLAPRAPSHPGLSDPSRGGSRRSPLAP
jgi:hypothetical protein